MRFLIKENLPLTEAATAEYIASWRKLLDDTNDLTSHELQRSMFSHLYDNLNILDSKTNSLLQLSGILIAAYTFVSGVPAMSKDQSLRPLFGFGAAYAVVAMVLCLRVIWLHWSSRSDLENADQHMRNLIGIRTFRTIQYRRAWTFTCLSIFALLNLVLDIAVFRVHGWSLNLLGLIVFAHLLVVYVYDAVVASGESAPKKEWSGAS